MMDKMMRKLIKTVIGILIFLAGLSLFFYPDFREWKNRESIKLIREEFEDAKEDKQKSGSAGHSPQKETDETKLDAKEKKEMADPELYKELQRYNARLLEEGQNITDAWSFSQIPDDIRQWNPDAIGFIDIPEIELSLPLYIGATDENMAKGAVVLAETSMPIGGTGTNCVIAAHRGWKGSPYFRDIDKLMTGSRIRITTVWGELDYLVSGSEIVHETDCSILKIQPGKDMVTLFSCYPYMSIGTSYRLAVFCERTDLLKADGEDKKENLETDGVPVSEILENDREEKGIIFEDDPYQSLYEKEDLIRRVLPAAVVLFTVLLLAGRFFKRKK